MLLTAARFYSTPSQSNARLLFRASLLHLPIFMAAFLIHRRPNTGEDRTKMLAHNVRLLGLGSRPMPHGMGDDGSGYALSGVPSQAPSVGEGVSATTFGRTMGQVSLPPLPFLPAPHLVLECPSKALCDENGAEDGGEESTGQEGARRAAAK